MTDLTNEVSVFGRPYAVTKSRLGAITKIYKDQYVCNVSSLHDLFQSIGEKLSYFKAIKQPSFSFLISFSDRTHHDGVNLDTLASSIRTIPIGKQTERIVMNWRIVHEIDGNENELSITVRISNPINPLIFLQAALSKSPQDIDNFEFEMGSTCVTVDGATQPFAEEVFLRIQNWIDARNKPYSFLPVHEFYLKYEWLIDHLSITFFPFIVVCLMSIGSLKFASQQIFLAVLPISIATFHVLQSLARRLSNKMSGWSQSARHISLFQITNGDNDSITKQMAKAKNSSIKLLISGTASFLMNVIAGIACWWITK